MIGRKSGGRGRGHARRKGVKARESRVWSLVLVRCPSMCRLGLSRLVRVQKSDYVNEAERMSVDEGPTLFGRRRIH